MTRSSLLKRSTAALLLLLSAAALADLGPLPRFETVPKDLPHATPFAIDSLKANWRSRIRTIKAEGKLPIIDIESSFNTGKLEIKRFAQTMDENGIALIAYSHDTKKGWSDAAARVIAADPWRFIPATNGGTEGWVADPERFLADTARHVTGDNYPLLGEFEFRHYPSPRQVKRGELNRDVDIPINGPLGEKLFSLAEKVGRPFEIHYEIEDALLPALEEMLRRHPKAKVIWCHLAQIRYSKRSTIYGPAYVRKLIETYPNLYFDLAFGGRDSLYPVSNEYHARIWNRDNDDIKQEWRDLIADHPWRFLAAMDLGGDRQDQLPEYARNLRRFLDKLPEPAREIVAYKAAWKLLFEEEI